MSDSAGNLNTTRAGFIGLVVLLLLVVLIRSPSGAPGPMNTAEGEASEALAGDTDSAQPAPGGSVAPTPAASGETPLEPSVEPPVRTGCFRSGSSRNEVRTAMGAPDAIDRGAWEYGQDWVTFGYGVVLDFSNEGGNLRLCD
jgi:hypothetical protein